MKSQYDESGFDRLKKIYALYDREMLTYDLVCQKKCASCCTCNVTLTSLEAAFILASLTQQDEEKLLNRMKCYFPEKRYIPKITTNRFATLCMQNRDVPEEENDPLWGKCPLLEDDVCTIYPVRPFGCRALISQVPCSRKGYAQMPPAALTLNNLFLQMIEQADQTGIFGNLSDMLMLLSSHTLREDVSLKSQTDGDHRFVLNEKALVLMVPPEHRETVRPVWEELSRLV